VRADWGEGCAVLFDPAMFGRRRVGVIDWGCVADSRCVLKGELLVRAFIWGLILGALAVPAAGYMYLAGGYAPVATSDPAMPLRRSWRTRL